MEASLGPSYKSLSKDEFVRLLLIYISPLCIGAPLCPWWVVFDSLKAYLLLFYIFKIFAFIRLNGTTQESIFNFTKEGSYFIVQFVTKVSRQFLDFEYNGHWPVSSNRLKNFLQSKISWAIPFLWRKNSSRPPLRYVFNNASLFKRSLDRGALSVITFLFRLS